MINTEEKNKVSILESLKSIRFEVIMLVLISFCMGRVCLFNTFFFVGVAYVGAMFFDKQTVRWGALVTVLGLITKDILSVNVAKYILMISLITVLRGVMEFTRTKYNLKNQLVVTGISMAIIEIMSLMIQEFTLYKLLVIGLEIVMTLCMTTVLHSATQIIYEKKKNVLTETELAGLAFLVSSILCGMGDFSVVLPIFTRVYFKDVLIFLTLITATILGGISGGVVLSVILSAVLVVIEYIPSSFVAIYVFAALIGGLFRNLDRIGIVFAMALGLLLGFALFNNRIIDMSIVGAYVGAGILSFFLPRSYFGMVNWFDIIDKDQRDYHMLHTKMLIAEKLKNFSSAFEGLGKQFEHIPVISYRLNDKQMKELIEDTGESLCVNCAMKNFCWHDYIQDTYKSCYKMLKVIEDKGALTAGDIPPNFKKSCINAESFAYTLSLMRDLLKNDCKWQEHFGEARKMIAQQFNGVANSVNQLSSLLQNEVNFNEEAETKIKKEMQCLGIRPKEVMVIDVDDKKQDIHIYCYYKGEAACKERVVQATEKALGHAMAIKKYEYCPEDKYCYFELVPKKIFNISSSVQCSAKEDVSGDVYSFLELEDGKYLVALADGMGSGIQAKQESEMTIDLLERFLESGFDSEVALKIINSALVLKSDIECSTTVDLTIINQYTGVAQFLKLGASASFILRGDEVITLQASSLPIGILSNVDLVTFKQQLRDGDILIMVTDGMLETRNNMLDRETTFKHFILEAKSNSPEYMAKYLMSKTKNLLAGEESDDMTIAVARVWC